MASRSSPMVTLFFPTALGAKLDDIAKSIDVTFTAHRLIPRRTFTSPDHVACAVGGVTLSLGYSAVPIDVSEVRQARLPATAFDLPQRVAGLLARHRAALRLDLSGAAGDDTPLALCLIATARIVDVTAPDLLYWSNSNALYTRAQFYHRIGRSLLPGDTQDAAAHRPRARVVDDVHRAHEI